MNNSFNLILLPLTEKHMNSAKNGELIVDTKHGHLTIKNDTKYHSKTKELEARVNTLSDFKNDLLDEYLSLEEDITYLIDEYHRIKKDSKISSEKSESFINELNKIKIILDQLLSKIDNYYQKIHEFQYSSIRPYLDPIIENLKNIIKLKATINELQFLANEIKEQKISNSYAIASL